MASLIPQSWRKQVIAILDQGSRDRIIVRLRAMDDFQALFPGAFRCELFECLAAALARDDLEGRQVTTMKERGTVYEFIFDHRQTKIYSKINLSPDGTVVIIYSAHRPLKGDTL